MSGSGFAPSSTATVTIESTPLTLGTVSVASTGTFSASCAVPCKEAGGSHTVTVAAASGQQSSRPVTLAACAATAVSVEPRFTG